MTLLTRRDFLAGMLSVPILAACKDKGERIVIELPPPPVPEPPQETIADLEQRILAAIRQPTEDIERIENAYAPVTERIDEASRHIISKSFYHGSREIGSERISLYRGKRENYSLDIELSDRRRKIVREEYPYESHGQLAWRTTRLLRRGVDAFAEDVIAETTETFRSGGPYHAYKLLRRLDDDGEATQEHYATHAGDGSPLSRGAAIFERDADGRLERILYGESDPAAAAIRYLTVHQFAPFHVDGEPQDRIMGFTVKLGDEVYTHKVERDAQGRKKIDVSPMPIAPEKAYLLIVNGDTGLGSVGAISGDEDRHEHRVEESYQTFRSLGMPEDRMTILSSTMEDVERNGRLLGFRHKLPRRYPHDGRGTVAAYKRAIARLDGLLEQDRADVIVYFTGHGDKLAGQSAVVLEDGFLTEREIADDLSHLGYRSLLVIDDACFSGGIAERLKFLPDAYAIASQQPFKTAQCQDFSSGFWSALNSTRDLGAAFKSAAERQTYNDPYFL